jgi:hypothetical protein
MGIDGEDDAYHLSVPAGDLEDIGAPVQVRAHHHHLAVVQAALAAAGVTLEEQSLLLHESGTRAYHCLSRSNCPPMPADSDGIFESLPYPGDERSVDAQFASMARQHRRSVRYNGLQSGSGQPPTQNGVKVGSNRNWPRPSATIARRPGSVGSMISIATDTRRRPSDWHRVTASICLVDAREVPTG